MQEQSDAYSFPKDHMEGDETETDTTRREIFEETGSRPVFAKGFRATDEYDLREKPGTHKRVVYFLAECGDAPLTPQQGDIRQIALLPYEQALQCFAREGSRRVLRDAYRFIAHEKS